MVWQDVLDPDTAARLPMRREDALRIPSVSKARNLLVTSAKFPLRAIRATAGIDTDVTDQQSWLYRTNGPVSAYERMVWTIDDGIFYGVSLWLLDRSAPDRDGRRAISDATWTPRDSWTIATVDGIPSLLVDGVAIADENYLLINFPFEGLLNVAAATLEGARDTEEAWIGRMRNPIPLIELNVTDVNVDPDELKQLVADWAFARKQRNGAIGSTPPGVEIVVHGEVHADLFVEARNAIRTDVGSFLNVRASMLDGTSGVDSLTYTTKDGERNLFYELDLPFWLDPIAARLSLDDVVPRGTRVRFDMTNAFNQPGPTGAPVED